MLTYHQSVFACVLLLCSGLACAGDRFMWFPESPYVFIGAEYQLTSTNKGVSVFCNNGSPDTASLGVGQVFARSGQVEWLVQWTHHSCISQYADWNVYDAVGIHLKVHLW